MIESTFGVVDVLASLFVVFVGLFALLSVVLFVLDITQTSNAIRRNYPVVGRFRYLFQWLGEFFRQYFFAMDREEMPFNRAQRNWVNSAAQGHDNTVPFGSTKQLDRSGTAIFVNCPYPTLERDFSMTEPLEIGPGCENPYLAGSVFNISAMSFGAISQPAVVALSRGAFKAGCWMNTGEGGLSPYHLQGGADIVFQIGTAKYGVRTKDGELDESQLREVAAHQQVRMFEIKLSQGAKPGKGGILPGSKVTAEVADIRGIPEGEDSISPNGHCEATSNDELLDFICKVRSIVGKPVGFKTVLSGTQWLDELFAEINLRGTDSAPDFITVDGGDGGTGAAPQALIDNVGLPLNEALPMIADALRRHGLTDRIRLIVSGKMITSSEVAWALCAGANFVQSARGFMFALGCIQALKCNTNRCPTGITTHDKSLQKGLDPQDKAERVAAYHKNLVHEVNVIAHSCGVSEPRQLRRKHVRVVQGDGRSRPLDEIYPYPSKGVNTTVDAT